MAEDEARAGEPETGRLEQRGYYLDVDLDKPIYGPKARILYVTKDQMARLHRGETVIIIDGQPHRRLLSPYRYMVRLEGEPPAIPTPVIRGGRGHFGQGHGRP